MHRTLSARRLAAALSTLTLLACGGGGDGGGGPAGNTFSIQVAISASTLTIEQGSSGSVTISLTRGGGFSGTVSVGVTGLPTGVTVSVSPTTLTGSESNATVNVQVDAAVAPGSYTATVTASASGVGSATTTYQLTVTARPTYSLSVAPAALTVQAGTAGQATVTLSRTNFSAAVALTLDGLPAGITGVFAPSNATDNSILTLTIAPTVAAGTHTLIIKGTATGPGERTATLALIVTAAANYSLTVAPGTVTIVHGQSTDLTITINRTNFTGAVNLALSNAPTGVTGVFAPASATGTTSTLTLSVAPNAALGQSVLTVMGTAAGVPTSIDSISLASTAPGDRSATFQLTVQPPPSIALSANPATLSIEQGANGTSVVSIARTNYTASVALTGASVNPGIGVSFAPPSTTGATSTATVTVAAAVPVGTYPVTVTATGAGVPDAQTTLSVQVTLPVPMVTIPFCLPGGNPTWVGYRRADGTYATATKTSGAALRFAGSTPVDEYSVEFVQYAMAWYFLALSGLHAGLPDSSPDGLLLTAVNAPMLVSISGTLTDLPALSRLTCPSGNGVYGTVSGSLANNSGLGFPWMAGILAGNAIDGASPNFILPDVPGGARSFLAWARQGSSLAPAKVIYRPNINVMGDMTVAPLDFNASEAVVPVSTTLTSSNSGGNFINDWTELWDANGFAGWMSHALNGSASTRTVYGFPPSVIGATGIQGVRSTVGDVDGTRSRTKYVQTLTPDVFTFGSVLPLPNVTKQGTGNGARLRAQGTIPAEYSQGRLVLQFITNQAGVMSSVQFITTSAWRAANGGAGVYDLSVPALMGTPGFPTNIVFPSGGITTQVTATGYSGTPWTTGLAPPVGTIRWNATRSFFAIY